MSLTNLKATLLNEYKNYLTQAVQIIKATNHTHQEKAKQVNSLISDYQKTLKSQLGLFPSMQEHQQALLVLQYCTSLSSLEFRHQVWTYEYMALSRRVGELWERFCSATWDCPSRSTVSRIDPPSFEDVATKIRSRIVNHLTDVTSQNLILNEVKVLFELIGEINMREDEVFSVGNVPHVIDFKSGFGSNEKGNTIRLQTVGRVYKLWNPKTKLLFLVRQEENNNYLKLIKRSGLWDVQCGSEAYDKIDELTGSNIQYLRQEIINFEDDLSSSFWNDLSSQLSDLTAYLRW